MNCKTLKLEIKKGYIYKTPFRRSSHNCVYMCYSCIIYSGNVHAGFALKLQTASLSSYQSYTIYSYYLSVEVD